MKKITIYTDGACSGNPGPGGWGAILEYKGVRKEISGGEAETTNNRMELMGIIRALEQLKEPCDITFCSDSKYVMDGLSKGWAQGLARPRLGKKATKMPALNSDLWAHLLDLCEGHTFHYNWVKGHAGTRKMNGATSLPCRRRPSTSNIGKKAAGIYNFFPIACCKPHQNSIYYRRPDTLLLTVCRQRPFKTSSET